VENRYLGILLVESYNGIRALADFSVYVYNSQQAFWCHCRGMVVVLVLSQVRPFILFIFIIFTIFLITTIIPHGFHSNL